MTTLRTAILAVFALTLGGCGSHVSLDNAWSIKTKVDKMTDQKTVYAVDTAKSPIVNQQGIKVYPQLFLACGGPKEKVALGILLRTWVLGGLTMANVQQVHIRLDNDPEFKWPITDTGSGTIFAFNDSDRFISKCVKASRMLFQISVMYRSQPIVVDFDISGMKAAINNLKRADAGPAKALAIQQRKRDIKLIRLNLERLDAAAGQYFLEYGTPTATYDDLVGPGKYIKSMQPVDGEDYRSMKFVQGGTLKVTTKDGVVVSFRP